MEHQRNRFLIKFGCPGDDDVAVPLLLMMLWSLGGL